MSANYSGGKFYTANQNSQL